MPVPVPESEPGPELEAEPIQDNFFSRLARISSLINECDEQIKGLRRWIEMWDDLLDPTADPNSFDRQESLTALEDLRSRLRIQLRIKSDLLATMEDLLLENNHQD
ncbi:hypothetical protein BX616_011357 [Lobosporangium transversale]|uniref:Uncharacterized protein n=1 Tax=Lobosporangium transversale TaxID=64571 RepID=A0A1Y2GYD1_9FUNG|nr:hypothetical protein BCR41DRAFT_392624 [Lobosporangium transversale]KAF9917766.1 hypothetical protein BX616_011357 [Lobosporangium transversale]ORZ27299.1 hypothetical protein BCR41DRAFT_392624 [Lobosporangium transversale]|eukprot:XP_021885026.1 hypothetical protein BCR41DRAFT_392624 [Lobosporangium transversale]